MADNQVMAQTDWPISGKLQPLCQNIPQQELYLQPKKKKKKKGLAKRSKVLCQTTFMNADNYSTPCMWYPLTLVPLSHTLLLTLFP